MPDQHVPRGTGPWPVNNELHTVRSWFAQRCGMDDGRESESVVRLVLDCVSGMSRMDRLTAPWRASESDLERLALLADRLKDGEPVQYALGETSFAGLSFLCDRRALIPRPETEELLMEALRRVDEMAGDSPVRVLDIGTGSGILPIAWKSHRPTDEVHGLDLQAEALELATANAERLGCAVDFHCIDILQEQPAGGIFSAPFDVILSNPPYIPQADRAEMLPNVLDWEPPSALFVEDDDPVLFYRRIIDGCGAEGWLKPGGLLALECHRDATEQVADLIPENWSGKERLRDLQGNWRMVFARR
ncbi:MAG: N5-glutamine methyltransferase family protein [Flavobacteriales bacterium]